MKARKQDSRSADINSRSSFSIELLSSISLLFSRYRARQGIAALIAVMTITLFLISVAFLIANVSRSTIGGSVNESNSTRAQFLAEAGIQDALMKLARDQDLNTTFTINDTSSNMSSTVVVNVVTGSPVIITATSTISGAGGISISRTLQATVTLDADGNVTSISKTNL